MAEQAVGCPYCGTAITPRTTLCPGCGCDVSRASTAGGVMRMLGNIGCLLMLVPVVLVLVFLLYVAVK